MQLFLTKYPPPKQKNNANSLILIKNTKNQAFLIPDHEFDTKPDHPSTFYLQFPSLQGQTPPYWCVP